MEPPRRRRMTERAVVPPISEPDFVAKVPRPYPGGSYTIQSMGRWVDRLMGDRKARVTAAEKVEPFLMDRDDSLADPEPAEIPERCRVGPNRSPGATSLPPARVTEPDTRQTGRCCIRGVL